MTVPETFRSTAFALLGIFFALICGCGGGSGSGAQSGTLVDPATSYRGISSQAVVTSANAESLVVGGFGGARIGTQIGSTGSTVLGGRNSGAAARGVPVRKLAQALKLVTRRLAVPHRAALLRKSAADAGSSKKLARSSSYQIPGANGGSADFTLQINDTTGSFFGTVSFHGFTYQSMVTDGSCDLLGTFDANRQEVSQLTLSFRSLSMVVPAGSYSLTGSLSWTYALSSATDTLSMNMVLRDSGARTYWFKNYQIATAYSGTSLSQTISGRYYDPLQGYVELTTQSALGADYGRHLPSQGALVGAGAGGTWTRLLFQPNIYRIEAETSGGGALDWQAEHPNDLDPAYHSPPVAQAGADQSVVQGETATLDGSASSDPEGNPLSYSWSFDSFPGATAPALAGANTATPSFRAELAGNYVLRLSVYDGNVLSAPDTVSVAVTPAAPLHPAAVSQKWQYGIYGSSIGLAGLLCADLDGDGVPEIIAGASNGGFGENVLWYVVRRNASGGYDQVWRSENYGVSIVRILLADLNGDGRDDVVVALADGTIRVYDGPTLRQLPGVSLAAPIRDLAVADLMGDGHKKLVTTDGTSVSVYSAETGALVWKSATGGGTSLAVGNVDVDRALEVVTTSYGGRGYVLDGGSGAVKWESLDSFGAQVRLADLDGNGTKEIIGASGWGKITVFDGAQKSPLWNISTSQDIGSLLIADADGDGIPEIIYGDGQWGNIHAIDVRSHAQKWTVSNPEHGVSGIALADLDLDGKQELLWGAGGTSTGPDFLYVADPATGGIKWQNLDLSGLSALAVGDLNGTGVDVLLMATLTSNSGYDGGVVQSFDLASHAPTYQNKLGMADDFASYRAVCIGDLDGDGRSEFALTTTLYSTGQIKVFDGATGVLKRQSAFSNSGYFSALAMADLDGDGKMELVAGLGGSLGNRLVVLDGVTLQEKWRSADLGGYVPIYDIKVADLDRDGHPEIIVTLPDTRLIVFDGVTHMQKLSAASPARAIAVADIDGDGFREILVGRSDGKIDVYDGVSFAVKKTVATFSSSPVDALTVADLDGSGTGKWLVASGGILTILQGQSLYWRSSQLGTNLGRGNNIAVRDTDADGHPNIFIGSNAVLYQFKHVGAGL